MAANHPYPTRTLSDIEDSEGEMRGDEAGTPAPSHPLSGSGEIETVYQPHEFFCFGKVAVPQDAPVLLRLSLNLIPLSVVVALIGVGLLVLGLTVLDAADAEESTRTAGLVFRILGPIVIVIGVVCSVAQVVMISRGKQYIKTGWETEKELDKARRRAKEKCKKYALSISEKA